MEPVGKLCSFITPPPDRVCDQASILKGSFEALLLCVVFPAIGFACLLHVVPKFVPVPSFGQNPSWKWNHEWRSIMDANVVWVCTAGLGQIPFRKGKPGN